MEIYSDQSDNNSTDFLIKVKKACPIHVVKMLTDNGSQLTDRLIRKKKDPVTGDRIPSGKHAFDVLCKSLAIEHRLIPPRHPQTNGMVECFNGRISEIVGQTRFVCAAELESTLRNYLKVYNDTILQCGLDHQTPIQAIKKWHEKKPELFVKRVYNQAGLYKYRWSRRHRQPVQPPRAAGRAV
jgi:transposase InsO family protein